MKRNTKLALGLIAATAIGGAVAIPALANSDNVDGSSDQQAQGMMGDQDMMQKMMRKMMRMHGGMMGGMNGAGMMGGQGAFANLLGNLDADADGTVTAEEARAGLTALLSKYDADGNGTLSLDEFQVLHGDAVRERMVDRFQALDNDGDGQVTAKEISAPANRIARMQKMRAASAGGQSGMMNGAANGAKMQGN